MKCPKCGKELGEGKLLCETCGEEVKIVPDFDIELEIKLSESISSMLEEMKTEEDGENDVKTNLLQKTQEYKRITDEVLQENNVHQYDIQTDEYEEDLEDDDIIDKMSDYFPRHLLNINFKSKSFITAICIVLCIFLAALCIIMVNNVRVNSYDYQYEMAVECAGDNDYEMAIEHLEKAIDINNEDVSAKLLLAKYYVQYGQKQSAKVILKEVISSDLEYDKRDEVYDMLLVIMKEEEEYTEMGEILKECDIERIVSKYIKYAALPPIFNKDGGVYDKVVSVSLSGGTQGIIYYTLDGSEPTSNSMVYETPILLESGEYTIKAMYTNMYGVSSDVVEHNYYINLLNPKTPVINFDSGSYTEPSLIEVFHDNNTKIYYTMDGTVPTKNSNRYTEPIEMPYGVSNFSFIAINEDGLASEVINRTYQLSISANFSTDLAVQVLINNLWAQGKLIDLDGHVPQKLGINQYNIWTVAIINENMYYIVEEQYVDTTGKKHDTNNMYAIDVNTAALYKAYKLDEGKYNLKAFNE